MSKINVKTKNKLKESSTLTVKDKEVKLKEIYQQLQKKDLKELELMFDNYAFQVIQRNMNNCNNPIEKILLDIIELVVEQRYPNFMNQLFIDIQQSGLLNKIKFIIKEQTNIEEKGNICSSFSEIIEQLIRIYLRIMNGQSNIDYQIIELCIKVLNKNLNEVRNQILNQMFKNDKDNDQHPKNKNFEEYLQRNIQIIRIVRQFRDQNGNVPEQIKKLIKERIALLMHINCCPELKCPYCIISSSYSNAIQEFQSAITQTILNTATLNSIELKSYFLKEHNVLFHLTSQIEQFASQIQIRQEEQMYEIQQDLISPSIIASSLKLLSNFLINGIDFKNITTNSNIIPSLIKLYNYHNRDCNLFIYNEDQVSELIREQCRYNLNKIRTFGDYTTLVQLCDQGYARVMILSIVEYREEINSRIIEILGFIQQFINKQNDFRNSFTSLLSPIPDLIYGSEEQIEEQGGMEEIESHFFKTNNCSVMISAKLALASILNMYKNKNK